MDIEVIIGLFVVACAYFSYKKGYSEGYSNMRLEIATTIVDIHFEKEKVEAMKLEVEEIQKECAKLMEESKT
jgi:hypothetical protein|tara:strand:+ start:803 stop:1018 length:216 start_codon:yes stop_codon:yes gene_type:complete